MTTTTGVRGTKGFFLWLRSAMPRVYEDIKREFKDTAQLSGLGLSADPVNASTTEATSSSLAQTIKEIANVAAQAYLTKEQIQAQNKILSINLQRAQNGQDMLSIDPADYGLQASVGVGLTSDTKQMLMYGALGVGALWLLSMATGGNSRRR